MNDEFHLLVLTDAHYVSPGVARTWPDQSKCFLGCELIRRAIVDARRRGPVDAVALLGDLLNDGQADWAPAARDTLAATLAEAAKGLPVLAVPGNHDGTGEPLLASLDCPPGVREIGGYRFATFADPYAEGDVCRRRAADIERIRRLAGDGGGPIVALQHNPLLGRIDSDYPYFPTNRDEILADYAAAGVVLSLSGHYHRGLALARDRGVAYLTAPSLCEAPYPYVMVTLRGRQVHVEHRSLQFGRPMLRDCHAHTEFAYCRDDVTAEAVIERSRTFGLTGVCLTEHAPQLYCTAEEFWQARHVFEPAAWREAPHSRMAEFRRRIGPLRSGFVRVGLEVELDVEGRLTLHDVDRDWCDLVVGAVHWLPAETGSMTQAQVESTFLATCEKLLAAGVDVLAHPWRAFRWLDRPVPVSLYAPLADLLAATATAAEVNFHANRPDAAFFAACLDRGVKIAFGTDAHALHESALLGAHLQLLRDAAGQEDVEEFLF